MKRNRCSQCRQEIDQRDFFVETRKGKICSDCMVKAGPVEDDCAHLFKPRGPKGHKPQPKKRSGKVIALQFKEAL